MLQEVGHMGGVVRIETAAKSLAVLMTEGTQKKSGFFLFWLCFFQFMSSLVYAQGRL
jgi:hypothetical protein